MLLGPIFSIDMITTARRARHYAIRVIYACLLLLVLYGNYYDARGTRTYSIHDVARMSQGFFFGFAFLQLMAVIGLAPALAAGTVALERERRTIEYLFATDLSNAEIILGRLASRMLLITSDILVGLPILALTMLFGGIALDRLLIVFALTLSTALFIVSLSMAVSVGSAKARDAVLRSYAILFALLCLPPLIGQLLVGIWGSSAVPSWLSDAIGWVEVMNPLQPLVGTLFSSNLAWVSIQRTVICQLLVSVTCGLLAVGLVRRIHLRAAGDAEIPRRVWLSPRWRRRPAVGDRAMLWKELFAPQAKVRLGFFGRLSMILMGLAALAICIGNIISVKPAGSAGAFGSPGQVYLMEVTPLIDFIVCCGGLAIAARAATSVTTERERQCWDSLITTPLEVSEIVWAKVWGSLYAARGLLIFVGILWGLGLLLDLRLLPILMLSWATVAVLLFFGCSLGVFFSTGSHSSLRAMGSTLAMLLFVGGGYLFCCIPFMFGGPMRGAEVILAPCAPFLVAFPATIDFVNKRNLDWFQFAYVLGVSGYMVAGVCLAQAGVRRLRPAGSASGLSPAAVISGTSAPIVPQTVEEHPPKHGADGS